MATHRKMDSEEDQLFHSYPCAYYVQSPSTISHANSAELKTQMNNLESTFLSPSRSDTPILLNKNPDASRFTLSRYSSSRCSNNSFSNEKVKVINGDHIEKGVNRLIIVDGNKIISNIYEDEEDDMDDYYGTKGSLWLSYFSFKTSPSCAWITLQLTWRLLVSLGVALLVFYIATKPHPPKMSIKVAGIQQFGLGEGIDGTGVSTKILTCNCSMDLVIENESKLFGLHIHPPTLQMFYGRLPFATSRGSEELYAYSHGSTMFQLNVGTRNKPMYGAGRSMQDMLESGNGLKILVRVKLSSYFRVIPNLVKPKFHHQADCVIFLRNTYDKKHQTQKFNSTCILS